MKRSAGKLTPNDLTQSAAARWIQTVGSDATLDAWSTVLHDTAAFAVDAQRNVIWWSAGAEKLLGYRAADVVGEHCLKANRCVQCSLGCGIAEHGQVRDVPLTLFAADGRRVRLRKTARAIFDAEGTFAGGIELLVPDTSVARPQVGGLPHPSKETFHGLLSGDEQVHRVFQAIRNVAETSVSTLVRGESGTGKELVARALHTEGARRGGPFVAINCAALTPTLIESELFGHVRGAFTGAVRDRLGLFEQADGGTLFLDEVAELPLDVQAKLLRVLEERVVVRVGGDKLRAVDVRMVSATHRSLRAEVAAGRFREDLLYRLRVVPLYLPPLRERRGDVELLLWHFIGQLNVAGPRVIDRVAPSAMRALLDHTWPGNVRELRNVVEYAFAVSRGTELGRSDLPPELREATVPSTARAVGGLSSLRGLRGIDEAQRIQDAIAATGGHLGKAAELLGISRPTLWRKRRKYGV